MSDNQVLDSRWTRHLGPNDKTKFEQALRNDTLVLGRLLAILEEEYAIYLKQEELESQFDNPNWQYKIAYRSGLKAYLQRVMTLLNFLKKE